MGVRYAQPIEYGLDGTVRTAVQRPNAGASYTTLAYVPAPTPAELRAAPRAFPSRLPALHRLRPSRRQPVRPALGRHRSAAPRCVPHSANGGGATPGVPPAAVPGRRASGSSPPRTPACTGWRGGSPSAAIRATTSRWRSRTTSQANYNYGEQPPRRRFPLEAFLFTDGVGYCQQFSGAMALMLRMDGIPARVAAGFLPGSYDDTTHRFVVRAVDAHSWVEVYFAGIGWVPFNPTPSRTTGPNVRFPSARTATPAATIAATVGGPRVRATELCDGGARSPELGLRFVPTLRPDRAGAGRGARAAVPRGAMAVGPRALAPQPCRRRRAGDAGAREGARTAGLRAPGDGHAGPGRGDGAPARGIGCRPVRAAAARPAVRAWLGCLAHPARPAPASPRPDRTSRARHAAARAVGAAAGYRWLARDPVRSHASATVNSTSGSRAAN